MDSAISIQMFSAKVSSLIAPVRETAPVAKYTAQFASFLPKEKAMTASRRLYALLVVLAATAAVLALSRSAAWGPGLRWDSINYIGVARSLLAGGGWVQFDGYHYTHWPPLYPLMLAAAGFLSGFDPHAVAGPLNALLFGLTVLVVGHWLRQRIASRLLFLWACLAVTFALPLTWVASWALSAPAFILFTALALFYMDRFLRGDQPTALIWAALFTALACLTRYIGFVLVITLLPLALFQTGASLREKLKRGAVYALIFGIPVSLWLLYNLMRVGAPFGRNNPPPDADPLRRFLKAALFELAEWIMPGLSSGGLRVYAAGLAAAALLALAIAVGFALIRIAQKPTLWRRWISFCLCGGFALVYLASVGSMSAVRWLRSLEERRYWAPLYIPLLLALVFLLDRFWLWLRQNPRTKNGFIAFARRQRRLLAAILGILLFIWLGNTVRLNISAVARANAGDDRGYAAPAYANSDMIQFIREEQLKGTIFSHQSVVLYIHTDPANDFRGLPDGLEQLKQQIEQAADNSYVVWFDGLWTNRQLGYGVAELESMPALERLARLDGGIIFQINRG